MNFWTDDLNLIVYIIIIIPQPITYSGDQVVTPTALNTKNPWLFKESLHKNTGNNWTDVHMWLVF